MSRKDARHAKPRHSPSETPELKARILQLIHAGCTLSELNERHDMPDNWTFYRWRRADQVFDAACIDAFDAHAALVVAEGFDYVRQSAEGFETSPAAAKASEAIMAASVKYAAAVSPRKFGTLVKVDADALGGGVSISITSYAEKTAAEGSE